MFTKICCRGVLAVFSPSRLISASYTHQMNSTMTPLSVHFSDPSRTLLILTSLLVSYSQMFISLQDMLGNSDGMELLWTDSFWSLLPVRVTCPCSLAAAAVPSSLFYQAHSYSSPGVPQSSSFCSCLQPTDFEPPNGNKVIIVHLWFMVNFVSLYRNFLSTPFGKLQAAWEKLFKGYFDHWTLSVNC